MVQYACDNCEIWYPLWAPEKVEEHRCPECGERIYRA